MAKWESSDCSCFRKSQREKNRPGAPSLGDDTEAQEESALEPTELQSSNLHHSGELSLTP